MEPDKNSTSTKRIVHDSIGSAQIIVEEIHAEIPNSIPENSVNVLPPIILADPRYTFPNSDPIFTHAQQVKLERTAGYSRRISWLCIIDCILVSFILYFQIFYLILLVIVLPILGFFSSRRYNSCLSVSYAIYGFLILGMRVVLVVIYQSIPAFIIQGIIVALELFILYSVIRFIKILKNINENEKQFLLGRPMSHQNPLNPLDAAIKIITDPPPAYHPINPFTESSFLLIS